MHNEYVKSVFEEVKKNNIGEDEFINEVEETFSSVEKVFDEHKEYEKSGILEKLSSPENVVTFKVEWVDDNGNKQINNGYRVQYSSILGPYKGGLRFNKNVSVSLFKTLSFEQTFKNSLTGFEMGGGKGGSDFDPIGKSEKEIERFCHEFMKQLYPYIGEDKDIPAGDLGVGIKEIGYLYDEYIKHKSDIAALTGKPLDKGGLEGRKEATGYGLCYFVEEMLKDHNESLKDKKVLVSGIGNVGSHAIKKAIELGAKVIGVSDYTGYVIDENGVDINVIEKIRDNKLTICEYIKDIPSAKFYEGPSGLFTNKADIIMPCATQNEIDINLAKKIVENGVMMVAEGSNLPSSKEAIDYFLNHNVLFTPSKASNAGGVSCSYFEICQNRENSKWTKEKTDEKLKETMREIYHNISECAKRYNEPNNLLLGANIWAFERLVNAYNNH